MVKFLLQDQLTEIVDVDPNTSVLRYIRDHLGRTGTKEGCASGDCGACSVILGQVVDGKLVYRAINSCIAVLPVLHARQLLTVEDLAADTQLHSVQQAVVDHHGSQCGFCTPGFVMALFAFSHATPAGCARTALAGNLCRCTGYQPLLDAAAAISKQRDAGDQDQFDRTASTTLKRLASLQRESAVVEIAANGRRLTAPVSADEAVAELDASPGARVVAGGTDLGLEISHRSKDFNSLIYLGRVKEMTAIRRLRGEISVGAAVPLTDLMAVLVDLYPGCDEMLERFGSQQIRNLATFGGNLGTASPIGDLLPLLLVVEAQITIVSSRGERRVPIQEFFVDYRKTVLGRGELIQSVHLPRPRAAWKLACYKVSKRIDDDISSVSAAFFGRIKPGRGLRVESLRCGFGGVTATPVRAARLEQAFVDGWPDASEVAVALEGDISPLSDARASAQYRFRVAVNLLERLRLDWTESRGPLTVSRYGK